jgi:hypothetical protein
VNTTRGVQAVISVFAGVIHAPPSISILLGEVDLSVADPLAQDTAIDHRHDMTAELAPSAKFAGSGKETRMASVSSADRLWRSGLARVGVGDALRPCQPVGVDGGKERKVCRAGGASRRRNEPQPPGLAASSP